MVWSLNRLNTASRLRIGTACCQFYQLDYVVKKIKVISIQLDCVVIEKKVLSVSWKSCS